METVQTVKRGYESAAAAVQAGGERFVRNGGKVVPDPNRVTAYSTPRPGRVGLSFGGCGQGCGGGGGREAEDGGSVGGVGVNASGSFCG